MGRPAFASQSRAVPSAEVVASRLPSGLNSIELTAAACRKSNCGSPEPTLVAVRITDLLGSEVIYTARV